VTGPDLADFDAEQHRSAPGTRLKVDLLLERLAVSDPARHDALLAALADPRYTAPVVARVVCSWGHKVEDGAVRKWRARAAQ
jgi:hypothetical protein